MYSIEGPRKSHVGKEVKYCSDKCRKRKLGELDRVIEDTFVALLSQGFEKGAAVSVHKRRKKGDSRVLISCSEVEDIIFARNADWRNHFRDRKTLEGHQGAQEDYDTKEPSPNGMCLAEAASFTEADDRSKTEDQTLHEETKQQKGLRKAEERETVKCAARRGCVFGFEIHDTTDGSLLDIENRKGSQVQVPVGVGMAKESRRRACEAVMNGMVVEPSFAKGDWGIRWRE